MEESCFSETDDVNLKYAAMVDAVRETTDAVLPKLAVQRKQPWISEATLRLIERRNAVRSQGLFDSEKILNRQVRSSVRLDRGKWLNDLVASDSWNVVRRLRKGVAAKQGRLRNSCGEVVPSDERANLLAKHLEEVQWAVRPTTLMPANAVLSPELPVDSGNITMEEVMSACKRLKKSRAAGVDDIPAEIWKAVASPESPCSQWMLDLCKNCWSQKRVPEIWHDSRTALIFKKGDVADPANYRPISLLCISYKVFATIMLERLRAAGAETCIWPTQFGFRRRRGTNDALFLARRVLEETLELKNGQAVFLALDWAKAFDSISPAALSKALVRFGVPNFFVDMVAAIYSDRRFFVTDGGVQSAWHTQAFGISQGCPLSPFLFVMLMTVLLSDAKTAACADSRYQLPERFPSELVYADDTLILALDEDSAHAYMLAIAEAGRSYGLSLNWSKCEVMPVRSPGVIRSPAGTDLPIKHSLYYLGSILASDGRVGPEIERRIGKAKREFESLKRVWSHSSLGLMQKLQIMDQCIVSGLLHGLCTATLAKADLRRLDGFHARCLRSILGVPPAYYSRVSNDTVLKRARRCPLSERMKAEQQNFLSVLQDRDFSDPVRCTIFSQTSSDPRPFPGKRRVGRPRNTWVRNILHA